MHHPPTWEESWTTGDESVTFVLAEEAYDRVICTTLLRLADTTHSALRDLLNESLPEKDRQRALDLYRLAGDAYGEAALASVRLAALLVTATRDTFDPLDTMENNFQRALAAIGLTSVATVHAWGEDRFAWGARRFYDLFPNVTLGGAEESEAGDVS